MSLAYPRSDADRALGVGTGRVLVRETLGATIDFITAARRARGTRRLRAPYWA